MLFKRHFLNFFFVSLLYFTLGSVNLSFAQEKESKWFVDKPKPTVIDWDTNYYASYMDELTTRLYSSVKYTAFRISNKEENQNLLYLGNRNIILGFGATYSWFTLNIGLNFPFVNHDNSKYGKTNYLDLQTHMYLRKMNLDLYAQNYNGSYLQNSGNVLSNWPQNDTFQKRRDISTFTIGYNVQYVFNWKRFSYKAIYNQNEWQKKSAGSLVIGTNAFFYVNVADSSFFPQNLENPDLFYGLDYNRQDVLNVGLSAGYYYTLVIAKHFFISAGAAGGPGLGYVWINDGVKESVRFSSVAFNFNAMGRASIGYNSERVFVGASILQQFFFNQQPTQNIWNHFGTGNARIYLVYRISLKKPIKLANPNYWKLFNKDEVDE
ncbi:MAG TPA: DUF4421 domain-containing protein [Bacteroidales bacterium]